MKRLLQALVDLLRPLEVYLAPLKLILLALVEVILTFLIPAGWIITEVAAPMLLKKVRTAKSMKAVLPMPAPL